MLSIYNNLPSSLQFRYCYKAKNDVATSQDEGKAAGVNENLDTCRQEDSLSQYVNIEIR